ncbi:MAG: hypothetical protein IT377_26120 [Polyangiaceae bacterium]|nr:hypothetical protein [Polyangiaceae bacterium]
MSWPFRLYLGLWATVTVVAVLVAVRQRRTLPLVSRAYARGLTRPWKLVTFTLAAGFFVVIAPYSGDPTWDAVDAAMMSVLTYLTAPFSVGTLYRALRGGARAGDVFVAVVAWLFSASWCYDGWLVFRDGRYPPTWASNILASSILYLSAGLFWSVAHAPDRGVVFAFMLDGWPAHEEVSSGRVFWVAAAFALLVAAMMAPFIANALGF